MGYAILTATLLLLIQHGREGTALTINSNSTGKVLTGQNISLDISLDVQTLDLAVIWDINNSQAAFWTILYTEVYQSVGRLWIIGTGSLLIANSTKNDMGTYTIIAFTQSESASLSFEVIIYDPVVNVTVTQSPQLLDEIIIMVNLVCSASGDTELVTWTREGRILGINDNYILLDGNKTLQMLYPNRTYTGTYTCNVSNPLSWSDASFELTVSYATHSATSTFGMIITSLLGGILLAR